MLIDIYVIHASKIPCVCEQIHTISPNGNVVRCVCGIRWEIIPCFGTDIARIKNALGESSIETGNNRYINGYLVRGFKEEKDA